MPDRRGAGAGAALLLLVWLAAAIGSVAGSYAGRLPWWAPAVVAVAPGLLLVVPVFFGALVAGFIDRARRRG